MTLERRLRSTGTRHRALRYARPAKAAGAVRAEVVEMESAWKKEVQIRLGSEHVRGMRRGMFCGELESDEVRGCSRQTIATHQP